MKIEVGKQYRVRQNHNPENHWSSSGMDIFRGQVLTIIDNRSGHLDVKETGYYFKSSDFEPIETEWDE